jgi:arylsulfatase A-like enzyme
MKCPFRILVALCGLFTVAFGAESSTKPNIVLFLVDDMGWMDSSAYGSEYYETPNMERFAAMSMRFTDAYAVPLCSPTRATILSGQYSARHGITSASGHQPAAPEEASRYPEKASPASQYIYPESKNYLDPSLVAIAEVLKGAGYRTGHFGKWHLGIAPEHRPDQHGFETTWFCVPDPSPPSYFSPYGVQAEGQAGGKNKVGNITDGPEGEYIVDRVTDEAIKFIESHQSEPFFLNLWQYGLHGPWGHKEEYTAEFARKTDPRGFQKNPIMASMLKSVDESLGRILDKLDAAGLTENTLFVFTSDNGGNTHSNTAEDFENSKIQPGHPKYDFMEDWKKWAGSEGPTNNLPLREGKGRIYEGGQRVPLMIRWPGHVEAGVTTDALVHLVDFYPTILDAVGLEKPDNHILDGVSLVPILEKKGELERAAIFNWFPHLIPAVSVRAGDWKLIRRWEPHRDYPELRELYNLNEDLGETTNLAAKMPEKVAELETLMDGFIKETGALVPIPNPGYREPVAASKQSPTTGLVPKQCELTLIDGVMRVTAIGKTPFLGTTQAKFDGPISLTIRLRAQQGGKGSFAWKTVAQETFPEEGQVLDYTLLNEEGWQDVAVELPVAGTLGTLRIFLPAADAPVDVERIEISAGEGKVRRWVFSE